MALRVAYYLFTKQKKGYKKSNPHQRQGLYGYVWIYSSPFLPLTFQFASGKALLM